MLRGRENARLARAMAAAEERQDERAVGQFLVLGFGGAPRLLTFEVIGGKSLVARDERTGVESLVLDAKTVWNLVKLGLPPELPKL